MWDHHINRKQFIMQPMTASKVELETIFGSRAHTIPQPCIVRGPNQLPTQIVFIRLSMRSQEGSFDTQSSGLRVILIDPIRSTAVSQWLSYAQTALGCCENGWEPMYSEHFACLWGGNTWNVLLNKGSPFLLHGTKDELVEGWHLLGKQRILNIAVNTQAEVDRSELLSEQSSQNRSFDCVRWWDRVPSQPYE